MDLAQPDAVEPPLLCAVDRVEQLAVKLGVSGAGPQLLQKESDMAHRDPPWRFPHSSSRTQCRGSALTNTCSPSASVSGEAERTMSVRPSQSTWYWVKSPWNTRWRMRPGQTFTSDGGRDRSRRSRTVRTATS